MSSSKRGAPGATGPAPAKDGQPTDSTWPLPRKPVATTDTAPPVGKKQRPPEAEVPPLTGANAQPPPLRGLPSEKKLNAQLKGPDPGPESMGGEIPILMPQALNPHQGKSSSKAPPPLNTKTQPGQTAPSFPFPKSAGPNGPAPIPESMAGEIPILAPAALNPRQAKNTGNAPPPLSTKTQPEQPIPSFSFPRSAGPKDNKDAPHLPEPQAPKPLRTGQSGPVPVPAPLTPAGPKGTVPPVPDTTRSGPSVTSSSSRSEQPAPDGLHPGAARLGQKTSPLPERPGPAPSGPVPTPSKSSRKNTAAGILPGDQDAPQPLRLGKNVPKAQQNANTASTAPEAPVPNSKAPVTGGNDPFFDLVEPLKPKRKEPNANGKGAPPPPSVDNLAPSAQKNAKTPSVPAVSTQNLTKEPNTAGQGAPFTPLNPLKYNPKEAGMSGKNAPFTPPDPLKPKQKESSVGGKDGPLPPLDPLKPNKKKPSASVEDATFDPLAFFNSDTKQQNTNASTPLDPSKPNPKEPSGGKKGKNAPFTSLDSLGPSKAAAADQLRPGQAPTTVHSRANPADTIPRKPLGSPPRPSNTGSPQFDSNTYMLKPKTVEQQKADQQKGTNPFRPFRPNAQTQAANTAKMNPLGSSPPNPKVQPYNDASINQMLSPPLNSPPQPGSQAKTNPPIYRPSVRSPPPRTQTTTSNFAPPSATNKNKQAFPPGPPPRVTSPPGFSGARPNATHAGPIHGHSNSLDSKISNDSAASSSTATSTRPLNPTQRQQTSSDPRDKGYYSSGNEAGASAESPYMSMLLSLDRIPRLHNILVSFFVWLLLAGFVIIPGSFTSSARKQEGETVQLPVSAGGTGTGANAGGKKLSLTPANTAALVIGFVCIIAGAFGCAWLALRWRRNYVWLLNKLYLPLILNALAGLLATITSVYTQQAGEWGPQAVTTAVVEAVILVLNVVLFFVYNYWLLKRMRSDHEEAVTGGGREKKEKKKKKGKKEGETREERKERKRREKMEKKERKARGEKKVRGGLFSRFTKARTSRPYAAGSVV